ncbi:MAG TPA: hypothetical protein VLN56_02540 [Gammaproteobacteria bacterium]|nr:hypothetical protein [Gammaproteobacteria bacterium]
MGKSRAECEEEAYKYYPDPNFNPRSGGAGRYGSPGGRTDFTTSVPSAADYDRAEKNRKRYIEECMAGGGKEE